jgi:hypothetical protein
MISPTRAASNPPSAVSAAGASAPVDFSCWELECRIDHQKLLLHTVKTPEERRAACDEMTRLIRMRSPGQVEQMERARGLR